eukprot:1618584-Amphidinium_carterae.1
MSAILMLIQMRAIGTITTMISGGWGSLVGPWFVALRAGCLRFCAALMSPCTVKDLEMLPSSCRELPFFAVACSVMICHGLHRRIQAIVKIQVLVHLQTLVKASPAQIECCRY